MDWDGTATCKTRAASSSFDLDSDPFLGLVGNQSKKDLDEMSFLNYLTKLSDNCSVGLLRLQNLQLVEG